MRRLRVWSFGDGRVSLEGMFGSAALLLAALALPPQDPPHPSTQELYRPPVIRPFETGPGFGREEAQGDSAADAERRPLTAPVIVEDYARNYETPPTDNEIAYEQGVTSAEIRADQTAGPLDGYWRVTDAAGETLCDLVLSDPGRGPVEGGWRNAEASGVAVHAGHVLTLDHLGRITLTRSRDGWTGVLTANGRDRPVRLSRPN